MASNRAATSKKIVVAHCLPIDSSHAGTGWPVSPESTSRRTSPTLRSTTVWSQSSSSGPSMRFRWPRTRGLAWASSVSLSPSTHCREVRPAFSRRAVRCFCQPRRLQLSFNQLIKGGRRRAALNRLTQYLFTWHAEVKLGPRVDAAFVLDPSSQRADFHANALRNNYIHYPWDLLR